MQRKIASFSSASKAPPKELAAKPLPKGEKQYSFRDFNHDPIQLAAHRDDRIFRSSQIWIQGLPTDPLQAMEIISHIGQDMKVSISTNLQAPKSGTWPPKPVLFKKDLQNGPVNLKLVASTLVLPYYDVTIRYLFLLHLYRSYGCYCTLTDFDQIGDI